MDRSVIDFFVLGTPRPAGSKRGFIIRRKGGAQGISMADSSGQKGKEWRSLVRDAALQLIPEPLPGPLSVDMLFTSERPRAQYRKDGSVKPDQPFAPTTRPDVLKLARAVEDALTGILWADDSQIVVERLEKRYGRAGVRVRVRVLVDEVDDGGIQLRDAERSSCE